MKVRLEKRHRFVTHTVGDNPPRLVKQYYDEPVPVAPRDWQQIVLGAVSAGAGLMVTASVIWSTTSVGSLLARVAPAPAAYIAAFVFDTTWIICMAVQWLSRYDRKRAKVPTIAGYVALGIAMAALCVNGYVNGSFAVGVASAAVSALAKASWTIVLHYYSRPLDDLTQQWVEQYAGEVSAQLALADLERQLARSNGQIAALRASMAGPALGLPQPEQRQESQTQVPPDVRAAVRITAATVPGANAQQIAAQMAAINMPVDPATIQRLLDEADEADGPDAPGNGYGQQPQPPRLTDLVRDLLRRGDPGKADVVKAVLQVLPSANVESIRRIYDRETGSPPGAATNRAGSPGGDGD